MNDLTKEELQELFYAYNVYCVTQGIFLDLILQKKIQFMIDNYCEHTWTDGSGNMIFCNKCQAYGGKK